MRVQWLLLSVFLMPVGVSAQVTSASALNCLARQIVEDVKKEHGCEFVLLWTHLDNATREGIARVFLSGEDCDSALADANRRGDTQRITFAKLQSRDELIRRERGPQSPQPARPRQPPDDFTLLHEVVD